MSDDMEDSSKHNSSASFDILNANLYTQAQLFGKHISIQTIWPDQLRIFQLKQLKQTNFKALKAEKTRISLIWPGLLPPLSLPNGEAQALGDKLQRRSCQQACYGHRITGGIQASW